ncbi:PIG-L family deacetylase [Acutalibacter muris]|jgi:LmbE family N-acetylglucosaminyl deacetylase|uniref:PIG-L family deacetylase n=1 Tax=Acutalibacter muris TaxID=1796620 RepID=UPI00272E6CCF|nr:PIG-L family deacetylase [Acutalibacter muris]
MILAPHPDDEFLNCTAVLSRAREITVVYATNGDFEGRAATEIRFQESVSAMRMLNLGPENMIVLGYGDRGGTKNSSFLHKLWGSGLDELFVSETADCTYGPETHPEYRYQCSQTHAPYTRRAFLDDLKSVLSQVNPQYLFLPSVLDFHWDHRCLNKLAYEALDQVNIHPVCFTFLTHYGRDRDWPNRNGPDFLMPEGFPHQIWFRRIEAPVSIEQKSRLLAQFSSQKTADGYLDAFCKRQEIYWREIRGVSL